MEDNDKSPSSPPSPLTFGISRFTWLLLLLAIAYVSIAWASRFPPSSMTEGEQRDFRQWINPLSLPYFPRGPGFPDSGFYDRFADHRSAGYPLFLDLFPSLEGAVKAQIILMTVAVAFLGWCLHRALGSPWLAGAAVVLLLALGNIIGFQYFILSEALFLPLIYLMLGMLILSLKRPRASAVFCAALLCGLAIAVRPAGVALLAIWPFLLWLIWRRCPAPRWRLLTAVLAPLIFCSLAESLAWRAYHPGYEQRPSFVCSTLFAKALLIKGEASLPAQEFPTAAAVAAFNEINSLTTPEAALAAEPAPRFMARMRQTMAPLREPIYNLPDWQLRAISLEMAETLLERRPVAPTVSCRLPRWAAELANWSGSKTNPGLGQASLEILLASPAAWLKNALLHYRAMWFNYRIYDDELLHRYLDYAAGLEDPPLLREKFYASGQAHQFPASLAAPYSLLWEMFFVSEPPLRPKPQWMVALNRLGTAALFLASLTALGLAAWNRLRPGMALDKGLAAGALCALIVHAYYLVHGLLGSAQMRYALTLWPVQLLCALLLLNWGLSQFKAWRGYAAAPPPDRGAASRSAPPA